jgi:hypothetical protein
VVLERLNVWWFVVRLNWFVWAAFLTAYAKEMQRPFGLDAGVCMFFVVVLRGTGFAVAGA